MSTGMFIFTKTPEAQDAMWSQLRQAETQRLQYQQAANAAVARSIGDLHSRVPYADPGVTLAVGTGIARGQIDPHQAAAAIDQSTAAGNRPAWSAKESAGIVDAMRVGAGLAPTAVQNAMDLKRLEVQAAAQSDKLIRDPKTGAIDPAATMKAAGVKKDSGGGFDWSDPLGVVKDPLGFASAANDAVGTAVKGVTREALSVASSGWEELQNRAAQAAHNVGDIASSVQSGDIGGAASGYVKSLAMANPLGASQVAATGGGSAAEAKESLSATNVAQQVAQYNEIGSVDLGSGFFPGGTVTSTWQPQAARDVRGVIPGTNSAWTPGRAIANLVAQPGTKQYDLMSGAIDGATQFAFDPSIALSDAAMVGRKAGQLIEAAPRVAEATEGAAKVATAAPVLAEAAAPAAATVGPDAVREAADGVLINAERPSVNAMRADRLIEHPTFQPYLQRLTDNTDPLVTMQMLGDKAPPSLISAVTKSSDIDVTKALMRDEMGLSFRSTADLPGLQWNYDLKRQVIRHLPGIGDEAGDIAARSLTTVPDRHLKGFRWDATPLQERQTMNSIHDALKTVDVPYADRSRLMGEFADAFAAGDSESKYTALKHYSSAINQAMKAMGAPEDFANKISRVWQETHDGSALYGVDALGRPSDSGFMATATGNANLSMISPAKLSEGMSGDVFLPDFRQVRRMTSWSGRVLADTSGEAGTEGQILKPGLSHAQYAAEKIFPRLQVTRVATALKIFADEQIGMAAAGLPNFVTHPFQMASLVAGSSADLEKLGYDSRAVQSMLDEVGASIFKADAPEQTLRTARATGHWDDVPFASEKGVQGGLDTARQFNRDPISAMWAQGKTTDQIIDWLHGVSSTEQTVQTRALADLQAQEGALFHGTSRPWTTEQPNPDIFAGRSAENLMGAGLYTTDNPKVALSYTSKGAGKAAETLGGVKVSEGGRVYQMRWQSVPNVLDLERPQPEVSDFLRRWVESNRDADWLESTQEDWDNLERLVVDPDAPAAAQIKAWRKTLSGLPMGDADDTVADLAAHLSETHDALKYAGGVRTGNETHNAYVVLHPEKLTVEASHAPVGVATSTERVVVPTAEKVAGRNGPDAFKQYVKMGQNAVARDVSTGERIAAPVDLTDDSVLRGWIEQNVGGQVDTFTKGNTDLRNAIGYNRLPSDGVLTSGGAPITMDPETGAPLGVAFQDGQATPEFKRMVRDWSNHPDAPERVKWNRTVMDRPDPNSMMKQWDSVSRTLMGGIFDTPLKTLTRSPLFRASFYDRVAELGSKMSPEAANQFLAEIRANADGQGFVGKVADWLGGNDRLGKVVDSLGQASGDLTKDEVTHYALGHAIDTVHSALFSHDRITNLEQTLRSFVPFVGAWRQVLGRWTRLVAQNPGIVRRFETAVQGARGAGFFATDPITGEERFNIPGSDWVARQFTGGGLATAVGAGLSQFLGGAASHLPVVGPAIQSGIQSVVDPAIRALPVVGAGLAGAGPGVSGMPMGVNVKDFNIVSASYLPGMGAVLQMPTAAVLGNIPQADFIRGLLMPYGTPTDENTPFLGQVGAYLLPGWMQKVASAVATSPDSASSFGNTYLQVVQNLASSGKYGTGMDARRQMLSDAKNYARVLTVLRGLGQFVSPASPSYDAKVATKEGDVLMSQLAADYHTMESQDFNSAPQRFIDTYGEGPIIAAMSKTKSANGGLDASTEFGNWERDHGGVINSYPDVGSYFAPVGSDFDSEVYNRQLHSGERKKLTGDELVNAAQATIAKWKYRQLQAMLGAHPNVAQLNWLTDAKMKLQEQYPGYAVAPGNPTDFAVKIQQLTKAQTDPELKGDIQTAVATYLYYRNQALTSAQKRAGGRESAGLSSDKDADLRAWLAGAANQIIAQYPSFARLYTNVLSGEVDK